MLDTLPNKLVDKCDINTNYVMLLCLHRYIIAFKKWTLHVTSDSCAFNRSGSNHDFEVKKWRSLLKENLTWNFAEVSLNKYISILGNIQDF